MGKEINYCNTLHFAAPYFHDVCYSSLRAHGGPEAVHLHHLFMNLAHTQECMSNLTQC